MCLCLSTVLLSTVSCNRNFLTNLVTRSIREIADVSSESEDEIEVGGARGKHDLLVKQESKPGFFKQSKKQHPMFPFVEEKIKIDEYGEIIK